MRVIVDTSVFKYLAATSAGQVESKHFSGVVAAQIHYLMSGIWATATPFESEDLEFIWVTDIKPYWRTEALKDPWRLAALEFPKPKLEEKRLELKRYLAINPDADIVRELADELSIAYKGGRKFPSKEVEKCRKVINSVLNSLDITTLGVKGYEADDMAAALVRINKPGEKMLLLTIDSDWLGLVNDDVSWYCMRGFTPPRYRHDIGSINLWASKRLKVKFDKPSDIFEYKAQYGDKSDNMPPNPSLLPYIDLLNPLEDPLRDSAVKREVDLAYYGATRRSEISEYDIDKALEYLRVLGLSGIPNFFREKA